MTYMLLLNCALKLVEEVILYCDARSKKHKKKRRSVFTARYRLNLEVKVNSILKPFSAVHKTGFKTSTNLNCV